MLSGGYSKSVGIIEKLIVDCFVMWWGDIIWIEMIMMKKEIFNMFILCYGDWMLCQVGWFDIVDMVFVVFEIVFGWFVVCGFFSGVEIFMFME